MALAKLTLTACSKSKHTISGVNPFSVMINPETISLQHNIKYTTPEKTNEKKYINEGEWDVKIPSILLDTTGAIPQSEWPSGDQTILDMIEHLKKVVCKFYGQNHEPPIIHLQWGSFIFWVRLKKMDVKYTLFSKEGTPVRAEVTLDFGGFETEKENVAKKNSSSPDLTHYVEVNVGDTLPLMCERVYKNPLLYMQVAKVNGLTNFRNLKPGSRLYFPPIVD